MKKVLTAILCLFIMCSVCTPIGAKSIERISSNGQIENASQSYIIEYNGQSARVFYGSTGIDIVTQEETIHFPFSFAITKLLPIQDVNSDGYVDFAINMNNIDLADNFFIISGKDGSVISSTCLTRTGYDKINCVEKTENTEILKMIQKDGLVYLLYDYTIQCIDPATCEAKFTFVNEDNIWDMEFAEEEIVAVDQLGNLLFINMESGDVNQKNKLGNLYEFTMDWGDEYSFSIQMNLWDVLYQDGYVYVTSEDGYLYIYNREMDETNEVYLNNMDIETYKSSINYRYNWNSLNEIVGEIVGINNGDFKSYQIVDSNDQYLLISAYVFDEEALSHDYSYLNYQSYLLYDKTTMEVVLKTELDGKDVVSACISQYQENPTISLIYAENNDNMKLEIRGLDNLVAYQKSYPITSTTNNAFVKLTYNEDGSYLVESYGSCCCNIDAQGNLSYLFRSIAAKMIGLTEDSITLLYSINGKGTKIVNYQLDCATINWEYEYPVSDSNHGIESVSSDDFNNDGVNDFVCVIKTYDKDGNAKDSIFLILNGVDGSVMINHKIFLYKDYDEKGNAYNVYLLADSATLLKDFDGDGKKELLAGGNVVSSRTMTAKGYISSYIDFNGSTEEIGDVNGDGFIDYLGISDSQAIIFTSRRSSYDVSYAKTSTTLSLDKNDKIATNSLYRLIGDVNNDGVQEIAISGKTSTGYQTYDVYDGKTLKFMYCLYPNGVKDSEAVTALTIDINGDGYNELLKMDYWYGAYGLVDGQTGQALKYFNRWENWDYSIEDIENNTDFYHPDYTVWLYELQASDFNFIMMGDADGDGLQDFAIVKEYYDYETWDNYQAIFIYGSKDFEVVDEIILTVNQWSEFTLQQVNGSKNLIALKSNAETSILDTNSNEVIAKYALGGSSLSQISEDAILLCDTNGALYRLETNRTFEITSSIPEETDEYTMTITWENKAESSTMTIKDNGTVIYSGVDTQCEIRLTEGTHSLVFSSNDGQGKSSSSQYRVNVSAQRTNLGYVAGAAGAVALLALFLNIRRKAYISKAMKGGNK